MTKVRLTLAEAEKIIATPPTVLYTALWETPVSWVEYQRIVGSGALPERWRMREWTIHGATNWKPAG